MCAYLFAEKFEYGVTTFDSYYIPLGLNMFPAGSRKIYNSIRAYAGYGAMAEPQDVARLAFDFWKTENKTGARDIDLLASHTV